jgi:pimeloyl-ACP methyl ester carboxylesterase
MWRWITTAVVGVVALAVLAAPAIPIAQASHLPGKTIVLLGSIGRNVGETPWKQLREQLAMRGFPASEVLEFQYAGGTFGPDGAYTPNPGGMCESYSKASFLALRQLMTDLKTHRAENEVFLVGHGVGGFVATQALWGVAGGVEDPAIWSNLSGIVSISGPMAGLSSRRTPFEVANATRLGCADPSMVLWMEEVGDPPERYATVEQRAALVTQGLGFKIGSFGNTVDCAYYFAGPDVCPKVNEAAGGRGTLVRLLGDERLTMFAKTGTLWKEYNLTSDFPGDLVDNHSALLLEAQPMAEVAEFVLSQTK